MKRPFSFRSCPRREPRHITSLLIERLEDRYLLSAPTADIVLIIDDSESMTIGEPGTARPVLDFVTDKFLPALDEKLAEYEIGTDPAEPNRFGLVTFGGGMTLQHERIDPLYQTWGPGGSSNSHPTPRPIPLDPSAGFWDPVDQTPAAKEAEAETLKRVYLAPIPIQTDDPDVPGLAGKTGGGDPAGIINNLPETQGVSEDSWQAVDYVFTVEYHLDEFGVNDDPIFSFIDVDPEDGVNDIAEFLPTGPLYDFREDAAIHFILISDTGRIRHFGDWPVLPWDVTVPEAPLPSLFEDQWADWDDANLETLANKLSHWDGGANDIGLTAFVPAKFQPLSNEEEDFGQPIFDADVPILGVDVNVIDGWNIDEYDPLGSEWLDDPLVPPETDDYVVYHAEDITGAGTGKVVGTPVQGNLLDKTESGEHKGEPEDSYKAIIEEISCWEGSWCHMNRDTYLHPTGLDYFFDYEMVDQAQIDQITGWEGDHIHGVEETAFLAWEARGTVWTSAYLGFDMIGDTLEYPLGDPDPVKFNALMDLLSDAMAQDVVNKITGPRVTGVAIVGPNSADGEDGEYSIPDGNGDQLKTVPIGGANIIKVTFSEDVPDLEKEDLSLTGSVGDGTDYGSGDAFIYDRETLTATWTFTDPLPPDMMELEFSGFTDRHDSPFDGDWTNPDTVYDDTSDVFPSGNGIAGGEFQFHFTIMPGDIVNVDGDPSVDNAVGYMSDYTTLITNAANSGGQGSFGYHDGDLSGDGYISVDDLQILASAYIRIWDVWGLDSLFGDVNDDGAVNGLDVAVFVDLMVSGLYDIAGDMNEDGEVNGLDVDLFVAAITGG